MSPIISSFQEAWRAKFALAAVFLAASLLQACAGATVHSPYRRVDDLSSFLTYAAPEGEAQLEILGNPFEAPDPALAAALVEGFRGAVKHGPNLTFSTQSATARPGYRFVVAFGIPVATDAGALCRKTISAPQKILARPVQAKAVFCLDGMAYSEVSGSLGEISGPGDPSFGQWARNMMAGLTPIPVENYKIRN